MTVLDSSCWIEIFSKGQHYTEFEIFLQFPNELIVPTIILTEVFKKLLSDRTEKEALYIIGQMEQAVVVDLSRDLSLESAKYGKLYKLPLADSIIYATTLQHNATLFTFDKHFEGLPNVKYYQK